MLHAVKKISHMAFEASLPKSDSPGMTDRQSRNPLLDAQDVRA